MPILYLKNQKEIFLGSSREIMSDLAVFQPILKSKQDEEQEKDNVVFEAFSNAMEPPPLFKAKKIEAFVSEEETRRVMKSVFTAVGLMIAAMFFAFLFTWAYNKEKTLFFAIYCFIAFLLCVLVVALVSIVRSDIKDIIVFYILIGSSAFFALLNIVLMLVFGVVAFKRMKRGYVPSGVQDYVNP